MPPGLRRLAGASYHRSPASPGFVVSGTRLSATDLPLDPLAPLLPAAPPRGLIREPRAVPEVGRDVHLPAVPPQSLQVGSLRARFASTLADDWAGFEPELRGDGQRLAERTLRGAAVLVPLVQHPEGLSVLLTRRTEHLNDHAGQISFPGGRTDAGDADAVATALREAQEEVGLAPAAVEVIGRLPVYTTVTAYEVTPVIGLLAPQTGLHGDAFEVAEVFEVPLSFLMDPAHHRRHAVRWEGIERQFLSMPWIGPGADGVTREYFIWGATAAMLRNLYAFLAR